MAIFEWFGTSEIAGAVHRHAVVRARAGTGKTTTILEAINYMPEATILLAAFNKRIADHLKGKLQNPRAEAKTLHAVGNSFITERWGYIKPADHNERADDLTRQACEALGSYDVPFQIIRLISKLHTKARELTPHATTPEQVEYLVDQFECEPDEEFEEMGYNTAFVVDHALKAMVLAMVKPKPHADTGYAGGIDFADMIFLPIRNKWLRPKWEAGVVDEAQDMAAAQLEIMQGVIKGRICVVGDDRQAIYGFRGADSNAIDRLKATLKAGELSLTTTYRCGHVIVKHNARLVPDFTAHHENHDGTIRVMGGYNAMIEEATPGDFVLSRKNAPLAEIAMALIRAQKRVKIAGRDIGKGLEAVAKKLATGAAERSIPMFLQKLQTWVEKECRRAMKAAKNEQQGYAKCEAIRDKAETLEFLTDGILSVRELIVRIGELFPKREDGADIDPSTVVLLSSIHKAKGLEANRVYVLVDTLYALPKFGTVSADRRREEENLDYVACTRAIHELVLVGQTAAGMLQPILVPASFEPQTEQDIDDKAEFDALAGVVHDVDGAK